MGLLQKDISRLGKDRLTLKKIFELLGVFLGEREGNDIALEDGRVEKRTILDLSKGESTSISELRPS